MVRSISIVGAGHAGTSAARTLREQGWDEEIVLLNEEDAVPYERPPLSKSVLTLEKSFDDIATYATGWMEQNDIQFRPGIRVNSIDRDAPSIGLSDGSQLRYDFLVLATGARARVPDLPGVGMSGVFTLRSVVHSGAIRERLLPGRKLVVIGGGLIGLEVAAAARTRGVDTTVLEQAQTLLARAMPGATSQKILELHRARGTNVILGADIEAIIGGRNVEGVRLRSGQKFAADTVLIAIGASPDVELARAAGLATDGGILVNQFLQTADPRIFAAGDAARYPSPTGQGTMRLESWKNALDQGTTAALNILGRNTPYRAVPWMWSDQFDKVAQVAGIPTESQNSVDRPLDNGGLATFLLAKSGVLEAAAAFGDISQVAKTVRVATSIIDRGLSPSPSALADPSYDLRAFLRADAPEGGRPGDSKISEAIR